MDIEKGTRVATIDRYSADRDNNRRPMSKVDVAESVTLAILEGGVTFELVGSIVYRVDWFDMSATAVAEV